MVLQEDEFARQEIAPPQGLKKSAFFEAINTRGLEQIVHMFCGLQAEAQKTLPKPEFGTDRHIWGVGWLKRPINTGKRFFGGQESQAHEYWLVS